MRIWMIPAKGKGHYVTARNIAMAEPEDVSRPLTTDGWDNAILYYENEIEPSGQESG